MLRDFVALPILRNHWVQKELFAKLAQLDVNYRDCRLSQHEGSWKTKLKAGDRAPDVAFQIGSSGDVTTVFKLVQPMQPIALVGKRPTPTLQAALGKENIRTYFVGSAAAKASDELVDVYGDFRRLYGMSGDFFCLIRPDDHIGLFQRPINETRIRDYLNLLSAGT
jgi:hypothetical protein